MFLKITLTTTLHFTTATNLNKLPISTNNDNKVLPTDHSLNLLPEHVPDVLAIMVGIHFVWLVIRQVCNFFPAADHGRPPRQHNFCSNSNSVYQNIDHGNYLSIKINGKVFRALLDTGSGTTLIKTAIARKLNLLVKSIPSGNTSNLFAAEGSQLTIDGVVDNVFNVNGLLIPHTVYVVHNIAETLILCSDFLSENQMVIDYANKVVSICN